MIRKSLIVVDVDLIKGLAVFSLLGVSFCKHGRIHGVFQGV